MNRDDPFLRGWLRLQRCTRISPRRAAEIVECAGSADRFADPSVFDLKSYKLKPFEIDRLTQNGLTRAVSREIRVAIRRGWEILHRDDSYYPVPLQHISDPPPTLTVSGQLGALEGVGIAFVGSRFPSPYGRSMAESLAGPLAKAGIVVVSGMAKGIDSTAHRAAIENGGLTVAVLGTGMDRIYPAESRELAESIPAQGALVTELAPGSPPLPGNFPRRNRIIVGMSLAVVVIEGELRSGSLVSARLAGEEGRQLLAVPGRAFDKLAAGPLSLLRDGAAMACQPEDIVHELPEPNRSEFLTALTMKEGDSSTAGLDEDACELLDLLPVHDELTLDAILDTSPLPPGRILSGLFALELAGRIHHLPGNRYCRANPQ